MSVAICDFKSLCAHQGTHAGRFLAPVNQVRPITIRAIAPPTDDRAIGRETFAGYASSGCPFLSGTHGLWLAESISMGSKRLLEKSDSEA